MTDLQRERKLIIDYKTADGKTHRVQAVAMYAREIEPGYSNGRTRQPYQFGKKEFLVGMRVGETKRVPFFGVGGYNGWHSTRSLLKKMFKDKNGKPTCDWEYELDDLNAELVITRTL